MMNATAEASCPMCRGCASLPVPGGNLGGEPLRLAVRHVAVSLEAEEAFELRACAARVVALRRRIEVLRRLVGPPPLGRG